MGRTRYVDERSAREERVLSQKGKLAAVSTDKIQDALGRLLQEPQRAASSADASVTRVAYLIASEPFDLVHAVHFTVLDAAAEAISRRAGLPVVGAYLVPWPEEELNGSQSELLLHSLHDRSTLCEAAAKRSSWIDVCPWGWTAAPRLSDRMTAQIAKALRFSNGIQWEFEAWHVVRTCKQLEWVQQQRCSPVVCVAYGMQDAVLAKLVLAHERLSRERKAPEGGRYACRARAFTKTSALLCASSSSSALVDPLRLRELVSLGRWEEALATGWIERAVADKLRDLSTVAAGDQAEVDDGERNQGNEQGEEPVEQIEDMLPGNSPGSHGKAQYTTGNAAKASQGKGRKIIAHACNDQGNGGRGFFQEIQTEWGNGPSRAYFEWHRDRPASGFALGAVQFVQVNRLVEVANMICQQGSKSGSRGPPVRYDAIEKALNAVGEHAAALGASVHLPRIGCGRGGGGDWGRIWGLIKNMASHHKVEVFVYG
mmetsp:Transcript_65143/g.121428  ORF Transcript_65143/g.121428 Transcript_65143/m.121428 type:complete len:485 (+) Transcript_65143:54-1508(+)